MSEIERLEKILGVIEYFAKTIFDLNSVEDIMWCIAENCVHQLGLVDCVIYSLDAEKQILIQMAAFGNERLDYRKISQPIEIPVGQGIVGIAALKGEIELVNDADQDPRYIVDDAVRKSELAVPIICDGEVIGVIDSEHPDANFFTEDHIRALVNIAAITANKISREQIASIQASESLHYRMDPNPVFRVREDGSLITANDSSYVLLESLLSSDDPEQHLLFRSAVEQALRMKETQHVQLRTGERFFKAQFVPLLAENTVNVYADEITGLIQAREEAVAANEAKAEFLSVMSHEMRTPLHAILGLSELVMTENLSEKQSEYLSTMIHSGQNLLSLVNDVLDFEKMAAGKMRFFQKPFRPSQLVNAIAQSFQPEAAEKSILVSADIEISDDLVVLGDEHRINQILNNLISNALKFTYDGGITIRLGLQNNTAESVELIFEVADSGTGIPKESQEKIFEAFEQVSMSAYKHQRGTGLGLAITKKLLESLNGTISVESKLGEGSTFTCVIPFVKNNEEIAPAKSSIGGLETGNIAGLKVLVVDDNLVNLKVAEAFLKMWNTDISLAVNGAEAIDKVKEVLPTVILMDVQMPILDGLEASQKIRTMPEGEHIKIIGLTADASERTEARAYLAGMDQLLTKPFEPEVLKAILAKIAR